MGTVKLKLNKKRAKETKPRKPGGGRPAGVFKDITDVIFNDGLKAIRLYKTVDHNTYWYAQCLYCGKIYSIHISNLKRYSSCQDCKFIKDRVHYDDDMLDLMKLEFLLDKDVAIDG